MRHDSIAGPKLFADPDRILCRHCGHDLEGLEWDADCPECEHRGTSVLEGDDTPTRSGPRCVLLAVWLELTVLLFLDEPASTARVRATDPLEPSIASRTASA